MKRTATPLAASSRTCLKSCATSCAESAAVGSSMISTRTSSEMALAISTACCAATVSPLAGLPHVDAHVERGEDGLGVAVHPPPAHERRRGPGGR